MDSIEIKSPTERYKAIADAIREKNGTTELMHPADMPQAILDIVSGGGGVTYTNIVYNEDDTITLTDKDGVGHTMECEYTDGKLTSVKYDEKKVNLTYDGDVLVSIGKTAVDMVNAQTSGIEPLDHTVTFTVEGEPYEVVSVKDGNSVNAPSGIPTSENGEFGKWSLNGSDVTFPYTPTEDSEFIAMFEVISQKLYSSFGVDRNTFPYILIHDDTYTMKSRCVNIYFCSAITFSAPNRIIMSKGLKGNCNPCYIACDDGTAPLSLGEILNGLIPNGEPIEIHTISTENDYPFTISGYSNIFTNNKEIVNSVPKYTTYFE
jgi:hypothetical protein